MTNHPSPQIIRTAEELETLDPDTLLIDCGSSNYRAFEAIGSDGIAKGGYVENFPAIVLATGEQVRAAYAVRTSLGESS